MVLANAENYEALYFLTDEEVLDAAACYRRWWEERQYPRRGGRLTDVTMNRFVVQGIAGGKKEENLREIKNNKNEETFIYIGSITAADSGMLCPVVCTGFHSNCRSYWRAVRS